MAKERIIEMFVNDQPGVMARITTMFARRGYNLDTITVGKTRTKGISKMYFTLQCDSAVADQLVKQCEKLIDVLNIRELTEGVFREMCLVKVKAETKKDKDQIAKYAKKHAFEVIHKDKNHVIIEMMAESDRIKKFLEEMKKFGIISTSRTGIVGMATD